MTSPDAARARSERKTAPWRAHRLQRSALWPLALLAAAAAYFAIGVLWLRSQRGHGIPSFDTYTYFYPNILYALRSLRAGGGLLWNPYQDCGQPFAAISQTGLLYPINLVFALLDREPALTASALLNLLIGGVGTFALCRELRLGVVPALCGAIAFELGGTAVMLAAWSPIHIAPYVWIPVAMWRVERLLRLPSFGAAAWLGIVLTLQLLPGFPQIAVFTYQLIALRTGWALVGRELPRPLAALGTLAVGCALPLGLGAVQLLPSAELARASLRGVPLGGRDLGYSQTWTGLREALVFGGHHFFPPIVVPAVMMLSVLAVARRPRSLVIFYFLITGVYVLLSLGPNGVLFPWYARLPLGSAFRMPQRFLWVCGFSVAMLAAFGAEALLCRIGQPSAAVRWGCVGLLTLGAALFVAASGRAPTAVDWAAIAILIAGSVLFATAERKVAARALVLLAVLLNVVATSGLIVIGLRAGELYHGDAEAFRLLRAQMTAQDRVMLVPPHNDTSLTLKSASVFAVPSVLDYEPQVSRAFADFVTRLRLGRGLRTLNDWIYPTAGPLPIGYNPGLLDLTAARFLLVARVEEQRTARDPAWGLIAQTARWTIYENPSALPRARFVSRIEVLPAQRIMPTLAGGKVNTAEVALLERAPAVPIADAIGGRGTVEIVADKPERVVLQVDASTPGYVYLADQYAAGWQATVNGTPAEILRANGAFRLVQVPAGRSEVIFRYRPRSFTIGLSLSIATAAALLAGASVAVLRRRRAGRTL